ncbi:unnamed protein product [Porites evermanni]|uniref:Uncharacterized protein n=1 Tax=Porites evermanni TaxID=104178 RepID=A0ABN8SL66_9CNID|nr:unnamed protein product [Porites evermanni]
MYQQETTIRQRVNNSINVCQTSKGPRNLFQAFRLWGRRYKIVWKFGSDKTKEKEDDKTQKTTKMRGGTIEGSLRLKKSTMKFV